MGFAWMFRAVVRSELFVAARLKVPFHFVEVLAGRRTERVIHPRTFGTTPTTKARSIHTSTRIIIRPACNEAKRPEQ
jgi:hypothetical protein